MVYVAYVSRGALASSGGGPAGRWDSRLDKVVIIGRRVILGLVRDTTGHNAGLGVCVEESRSEVVIRFTKATIMSRSADSERQG